MGTRRSAFDCAGRTTEGGNYESIADMWAGELRPAGAVGASWYARSGEYWEGQEASVEGMLGGLGKLDARDVAASRDFLSALAKERVVTLGGVALDVGAGIGRVAKHLLLPLFETVDMLEQSKMYLEKSVDFIGAQSEGHGSVGHRIACGMQDFAPVGNAGLEAVSLRGRYNVVWIQWCIIYLTDDDLVSFLIACTACLREGGVICIKDNVASSGFLVDKEDSSVMRSDKYLRDIFERAGLHCMKADIQRNFPKSIFPVRLYALRPVTPV